MIRARTTGLLLAAFVTTLAAACGSTDDEGRLPQAGKKSDTGAGGFGSSGASAPSGGDEACNATVAQAEKAKVDIIFVIDDSGSMGQEMTQVRTNVNRFADKVGSIGLDYRVLFITKKGTVGNSICVPPPLGGGNCTDSARFFHIDQDVQSNDSLDVILGTYDGNVDGFDIQFIADDVAPWKDKLRLESTKIFVEVTDDESFMDAEVFDKKLLAKEPAGMFGTAQNRRYVFHSIISKPAGSTVPSSQICPTADGTSIQYQKLSQLTGGLMDEVCKTDYSSVLDNIAKGIVDRLGCDITYPGAATTDPTKVVVRYTPAGKETTSLTQVTDVSKCSQVENGWYYDHPTSPTRIILCPTMCGSANASPGAKIEALVGCLAPAPR